MKNMRNIIWNVILITTGSVICAVAVNSILIPKQFLAGGFTGLSLLIHYALPFIPVGVIYLALNIPVFIFGWLFVGQRFFFYSIAGMLVYSLAVLIPFPEIMIEDRLLNALTAGIITGVGSGILLRSPGSAGGMDILAIIIFKKFSFSVFPAVLRSTAMFLFRLDWPSFELVGTFRFNLKFRVYYKNCHNSFFRHIGASP